MSPAPTSSWLSGWSEGHRDLQLHGRPFRNREVRHRDFTCVGHDAEHRHDHQSGQYVQGRPANLHGDRRGRCGQHDNFRPGQLPGTPVDLTHGCELRMYSQSRVLVLRKRPRRTRTLRLFFPAVRFVIHGLEIGAAHDILRARIATNYVQQLGCLTIVVSRDPGTPAQSCGRSQQIVDSGQAETHSCALRAWVAPAPDRDWRACNP